MNTGAILTAPNEEFEHIFKSHSVGSETEFTTRGRVSDQRLART
jgi:hypothetical protein